MPNQKKVETNSIMKGKTRDLLELDDESDDDKRDSHLHCFDQLSIDCYQSCSKIESK